MAGCALFQTDRARRGAARVTALLMIFFGLELVFENNQARADQSACEQIRTLCRNAGFVQGGGGRDGILLACYNPIVEGTAQPRLAVRPLPRVGSDIVKACRAGSGASAKVPGGATLVASSDGTTVYDLSLKISWLADGNLAAKQNFGVPNINKSGSMNYATAVEWVAALNKFNGGAGYLGHNNWQLPTAPVTDRSCARTGRNGESFGFHCSGSALGSLYYQSLGLHEPDTAVAIPANSAGPFKNFQPYLYWSGSAAADPRQGFVSFSFNTGFQGANVAPNYLYALPLIKRKLAGTPAATGQGLQVNPGGETIYDPVAQVTWLADANLAAKETFGISGVNPDGSMDHETAVQWIAAMNKANHGRGYLNQTGWQLPDTGPPDPSCSMQGTTGFNCTGSSMGELFYKQLGLLRGDPVVAAPNIKLGPFRNLQPYLYWACQAETAASPCLTDGPAAGFEWNFSFGNGFQGTNLASNELYVIVYYPDTPARPAR